MNIESIKEALKSGHKASAVLREVLSDIADSQHCGDSYGFEGLGTYPACGECATCIAIQLHNDGEL